MDEKEKNPTVIMPLEQYERLIRDSEKLTALATGIWNCLTTTSYGDRITITDSIIPIYAAVCPDDFEAWKSEHPADGSEDE